MSDNIDKWVEKDPKSWSKLAENTNNKDTFDTFKKKLMMGAKKQGKNHAIKHMTNAQIKTIFNASGLTNATKEIKNTEQPAFSSPKRIQVKRYGKTYIKTKSNNWATYTKMGLIIASKAKPRSKQYNDYVKSIVKSTGRTRQAVIKKIQRTRRNN